MKNKTQVMNNRRTHVKAFDWLYQEEEDDFLSGKIPSSLEYAWEDEE